MKYLEYLKYLKDEKNKKILMWVGFGVGCAFCLLQSFSFSSGSSESPRAAVGGESLPGIDTFIPKDHGLFPIQPLNREQLDGLMQDHAIVDLYRPDGKEPVARSVRLLRAPFDRTQFAALAPLRDRHIFTQADTRFIVVIRNPAQRESPRPQPHRRFVVDDH